MKLRAVLIIASVSVALLGLAGCSKAPELSAAQLQAGVIADPHPVNQQVAMERGCDCHVKK